GEYVVSFAGMAPADDPRLTVLVVIDGLPFYGGVVAAPVVQAVMLDSLKYLGVKPDTNAPLSPGTPLPDQIFSPVKKAAEVPSVLGLTLAEGQLELKKTGFSVKVEGKGSAIIDQIPHGDAIVEEGSTVLIYLGEEVGEQTFGQWWEDIDPDIEAIKSFTNRVPISTNEDISE
ncbi:MAG: PASTA domain-containing protein, partial [Eubacteriales bacterium]